MGAFAVVLFLAYFVPVIVAISRKAPDLGAVIVIDLFLGWTGLGWIVAMAMALRSPQPAQQINVIQQVVGNPMYGYGRPSYGPANYGPPSYGQPGYGPPGQLPASQYATGPVQQYGQPEFPASVAGYSPLGSHQDEQWDAPGHPAANQPERRTEPIAGRYVYRPGSAAWPSDRDDGR